MLLCMPENAPTYRTGEDVRAGDRVELDGSPGRVVFVIETKSYLPDFPAAEWDYLDGGIMVETEKHGLVLLDSPDEDLVLVNRL